MVRCCNVQFWKYPRTIQNVRFQQQFVPTNSMTTPELCDQAQPAHIRDFRTGLFWSGLQILLQLLYHAPTSFWNDTFRCVMLGQDNYMWLKSRTTRVARTKENVLRTYLLHVIQTDKSLLSFPTQKLLGYFKFVNSFSGKRLQGAMPERFSRRNREIIKGVNWREERVYGRFYTIPMLFVLTTILYVSLIEFSEKASNNS